MLTYVVDFESTDLKSDIGSLIVASFGELDTSGKLIALHTEDIQSIGTGKVELREKKLAQWAKQKWTEADIIIGQNHLAFDRHFLDGVLFRNDLELLPKRILLDTYQIAKGKFAMSASMKNMLDIWGLGTKDAPDKAMWRLANHGDKEALKRIRERCESDVEATARLWEKLKPVYMQWYGR